MMKKILAIFSLVALMGTMTGCKDFLDINEDPNYLPTNSPESLITSAEIFTGAILGGDVQLATSFWNQYYTQCTTTNQYWNLVDNQLDYTSSYFSGLWNQYYLYAIVTARDIQSMAAEMNGYESYVYIAKILEAFDWYILNSFYDRIAITNGMNGKEDANPEFDNSADSYSKVVALFEEILTGPDAIDVDALQHDASIVVGSYDYMFNGDMDGWAKFANTIYLKLLMRDFDANESKIEAALSNGYGFIDETSGPAFIDIFVDTANKANPLYEADRRQLNTVENIRACNTLLDILKDNDDSRIGVYYEGDAGAVYNAGGSPQNSNRAKLAATDPIYLMTIADSYFTQAEAALRLGQSAEEVKALYDAGVEAAFTMWDLDGSSYVADGGAYEFDTAATEDEMLEQIMMQKWMAGARSCAWSVWFDVNRTGYPARGEVFDTYSGELAAGTYPQRFMYPQRSALYNVNSPESEALNKKMWWHK